jgi:hypothetical protein
VELTITPQEFQNIKTFVNTHKIARGVGHHDQACSIASINLALKGQLTDDIPTCMSLTIGNWIIRIQDAMPHDLRNAREWRELLPFAAGSGRDVHREAERIDILLNWFWECMPIGTKAAHDNGFGDAWDAAIQHKSLLEMEFLRNTARQLVRTKTDNMARSGGLITSEQQRAFYRSSGMHVLSSVTSVAGSFALAASRSADMSRFSYKGSEIGRSVIGLVNMAASNEVDRRDEAWLAAWKRVDPAGVLAKMVQ